MRYLCTFCEEKISIVIEWKKNKNKTKRKKKEMNNVPQWDVDISKYRLTVTRLCCRCGLKVQSVADEYEIFFLVREYVLTNHNNEGRVCVCTLPQGGFGWNQKDSRRPIIES